MIALSKSWKKKAASERLSQTNASYRLLMTHRFAPVFFGFRLGLELADNKLIAARALAHEGAYQSPPAGKRPS